MSSIDHESLLSQLDLAHQAIINGAEASLFKPLVATLRSVKSMALPTEWERAISLCRAHPIFALTHEDPLTRRAYEKPRGYAGDAEMLDFIYDFDNAKLPVSSKIGNLVFQYTGGIGPSSHAVRYRRSLIAKTIDWVCAAKTRARILSIACGHLREAELSTALMGGRIREWVAIDQDEQSITECSRRFQGTAVRPQVGSVRDLLAGRLRCGDFDLAYAAGLFDYLSDKAAHALVARMFRLLKPGGSLLVANFTNDHLDAGYMEAFADWHLIYRTEDQMRSLLSEQVALSRDSETAVYTDRWGAITYLLVGREAARNSATSMPTTGADALHPSVLQETEHA